MARQNDAPGSGRVLVDIVIAAMAHLPALAHKPSRNFAPVRLKRWFWYDRASSSLRKYMRILNDVQHWQRIHYPRSVGSIIASFIARVTKPRSTLLLFQLHSGSGSTHHQ
jgi:hypothetical protein